MDQLFILFSRRFRSIPVSSAGSGAPLIGTDFSWTHGMTFFLRILYPSDVSPKNKPNFMEIFFWGIMVVDITLKSKLGFFFVGVFFFKKTFDHGNSSPFFTSSWENMVLSLFDLNDLLKKLILLNSLEKLLSKRQRFLKFENLKNATVLFWMHIQWTRKPGCPSLGMGCPDRNGVFCDWICLRIA